MLKAVHHEEPPPFIKHLLDLEGRQDRRALAELRRSLVSGNEMLAARHVLPWLGPDHGLRIEYAAFLVAGLFALHPKNLATRNFGHSMERLWREQERRPSIEQRFVALLNAHVEDLLYYMRQAIDLMRGSEIPVGWARLYRDICNWDHPDRYVQRNWARAFWGSSAEDQNATEKGKD